MKDDIAVLIVGAGASGLTLACDLQRRGIPFEIADASAHGFEGSRAKGIQPRTAEVFDDLGVLPLLEPRSTLYPPLGLHLGPITVRRTMIKIHKPSDGIPFANTLLAPQYATDLSLRERLAQLGGEITSATRFTSFEQDEDGVTSVLTGPDGERTVRSRYLVGADGGSSAVRRAAGIAFRGTTDENDRMIVADVKVTGLSRNRWHVWPRNGGRFMALCPLPNGAFQLMLKLTPDDPADLDDAEIERIAREYAARAKVRVGDVLWSSVWRPNIRLAEHYRSENVFLVGDAAHVHPPTGAQGLNTGVQDAYNLGWKIGQVLGGAPDSLLDTYESERQPVAARVLGLATALYAHLKDRPLAATARGDAERQLTLSYRGGDLASRGSAPAGSLQPGDRAPDSPYVDAAGRSGSLFDRFRGPHFTLIGLDADSADLASAISWPAAGAGLQVLALKPEKNAAVCRAYGVRAGDHVLVRPDGYIAAVVADSAALQDFLTRSAMIPTRMARTI